MTYSTIKYIITLLDRDVEEKKTEYDEAVQERERFSKRIQEAVKEDRLFRELGASFESSQFMIYDENGIPIKVSLNELQEKKDELESFVREKEIDLEIAKRMKDSFLNTDWKEKDK